MGWDLGGGPTPFLPQCRRPGSKGIAGTSVSRSEAAGAQPLGMASFWPSEMVADGSELSSSMR